jgi:hypothetical protein
VAGALGPAPLLKCLGGRAIMPAAAFQAAKPAITFANVVFHRWPMLNSQKCERGTSKLEGACRLM